MITQEQRIKAQTDLAKAQIILEDARLAVSVKQHDIQVANLNDQIANNALLLAKIV